MVSVLGVEAGAINRWVSCENAAVNEQPPVPLTERPGVNVVRMIRSPCTRDVGKRGKEQEGQGSQEGQGYKGGGRECERKGEARQTTGILL